MLDTLRRNETLLILCIEVILMTMGIGMVSPILPEYARSFGVSITMVGFIITIYGIARIIVDIPAGRLAERIGRRPVLTTGPLILAIGSVGCGLAGSYWVLLTFRFIQGVGSALYTTAAMIMLADTSTPANRGQVMSFYQGSLLLGGGMGPVMGGFIAQYFGLNMPFFVFTFMAVLASLWAYLRIPETRPARQPEITPRADNSQGSPFPTRRRLGTLLKNLNFVLVSFITFDIFFTRTGSQNQILPLLGADRLNLSEGQIGMALTLVAAIQCVTIFTAGRLSDRFGRKKVITPGCIIAATALVMLSQSYSYWFLLLSCVVMGMGVGISGPTPSAYMADVISREDYSIGVGLYRAIGDLGFVTGPILLGWLADMRGFSFPLLVNALLIFVAVLLFQVLAKERRV